MQSVQTHANRFCIKQIISHPVPDFRGPQGIWTTEERQKKKRKKRTKVTSSVLSGKEKLGKEENEYPDAGKNKLDKDHKPSILVKNDVGADRQSLKRSRGSRSASDSISTSTTETTSFEKARPTLTHRAITKLTELDIVKYCITQNVDGLHMRSGLSRSRHCFLHGCIFTEKCEKCGKEVFRNFDVGGVSFQKTGRKCPDKSCSGDLRDTILDWEDELPNDDWARAQNECARSDLVMALGTSLRIEPAGSLPTLGEKFIIVNKQATPYDKEASLVIRAPVDDVMASLMISLGFDDWDNCD